MSVKEQLLASLALDKFDEVLNKLEPLLARTPWQKSYFLIEQRYQAYDTACQEEGSFSPKQLAKEKQKIKKALALLIEEADLEAVHKPRTNSSRDGEQAKGTYKELVKILGRKPRHPRAPKMPTRPPKSQAQRPPKKQAPVHEDVADEAADAPMEELAPREEAPEMMPEEDQEPEWDMPAMDMPAMDMPVEEIPEEPFPAFGKVLYAIPREMKVQETADCLVRIARESLPDELFRPRDAEAPIEEARIRIGRMMSVSLVELPEKGFFDIVGVSTEEQPINLDDFTEWKFLVTPLKPGSSRLFLRISVKEIIEGFGERKKDTAVLEQEISVVTTGEIEQQPVFRSIELEPPKPDLETRILFLASNPADTSRLRLDEEIREIAESLRRSTHRDQFDLLQRHAVRPLDLSRALLDEQPHIIHFSGHGVVVGNSESSSSGNDVRSLELDIEPDEQGEFGIALEDEAGNIKWVPVSALAHLFGLFKDTINCVILNACYSRVQADAIAAHIPYVIGMKQAVPDKTAITFATSFYDALGGGRTVPDAFKLAKISIAMEGLPGEDLPVLLQQD